MILTGYIKNLMKHWNEKDTHDIDIHLDLDARINAALEQQLQKCDKNGKKKNIFFLN